MKIYQQIKSFYQNCKVNYGKNLDQIPWRMYALSELLLLLLLSARLQTLPVEQKAINPRALAGKAAQ